MPSSLQKRLLAGLLFLVITVFGGAAGYYTIGHRGGADWTFWDCLYMTVITVTTVGFGETLHDMDKVDGARHFTMVLLLFGTGSIVKPRAYSTLSMLFSVSPNPTVVTVMTVMYRQSQNDQSAPPR